MCALFSPDILPAGAEMGLISSGFVHNWSPNAKSAHSVINVL